MMGTNFKIPIVKEIAFPQNTILCYILQVFLLRSSHLCRELLHENPDRSRSSVIFFDFHKEQISDFSGGSHIDDFFPIDR